MCAAGSVGVMSSDAGADVFDSQLDAWRAWQESPWGRIRYAVVAETLRRTCAGLRRGPLRVIDVGGGDGTDAIALAAAGHEVTIVDQSAGLVEQAQAAAKHRGVRVATVVAPLSGVDAVDVGTFDLVLCHNVLQYVADTAAAIDALVALVGPGGGLSIMAVNPPSDVLAAAVRREDVDEAIAMLTAPTAYARTFEHEIRRIWPDDVATELSARGFTQQTRYGVRAVVDYLVNDERKHDPEFFDTLLRLELALCDREPYLRTARLWQLVCRRD